LTEVAALRPALASVVLLVGRSIDAFVDPLMGRISDVTRSRWGRRRPYFLLGAVPFGVSFALLWWEPPLSSQGAKFAYYASWYVLHSLAATVLTVPYLALLPELTLDYQERTSLSTFRSGAGTLGTLIAAVATLPLVERFGGGAQGYLAMGIVLSVWLTLPWIAVYAVSWERPQFQRVARLSFREGLAVLARHRSYRQLVALYLCSRAAMDLIGALFLFFFTYWLRRPEDFEVTLGLLLVAVVISLPFWLRISGRTNKSTLFVAGCAWWICVQLSLLIAHPDWPRFAIVPIAVLAGIGYAVADAMPWSMLGDVVDEDELRTGDRREGVYAGFFGFLRKLSGAGAVALAGLALDLSGFEAGAEQSEATLWTIRLLSSVAPACLLALAIGIALRYRLTRAAHARILAAIEERLRLTR
jgi:oligogalacturonide transporter